MITMLATDSQGNTRRKYIFERMCGVLSIGVEQKEGHIIFLVILSLFKVYHTGFKIPAFLDCVNWPFLEATGETRTLMVLIELDQSVRAASVVP